MDAEINLPQIFKAGPANFLSVVLGFVVYSNYFVDELRQMNLVLIAS